MQSARTPSIGGRATVLVLSFVIGVSAARAQSLQGSAQIGTSQASTPPAAAPAPTAAPAAAAPAPAPVAAPPVQAPAPPPVAPAPVAAAPVAATPATAAPVAAAADTTAAAAVAGPPQTTGRDAQPWDLTHRAYNTWEGSTGGIFIEDPGMAEPGSVRVQLGIDSYWGKSFLYNGDKVEQDRQSISLSWTALDLLEVYGSIHNRASISNVPKQNTLNTFGDTLVGAKLVGTPIPILRLGGGPRFLMQGDVGAKNTVLNAISVGLRGDAALDLQGLDQPVPFIARANVDYLFDNSSNVLDDIEKRRYASLAAPLAKVNETRNLISRVERLGLGVNRVDMFTLGLGIEVPLQLADGLFLHPTLDYRFGIPVNRQGFNCAFHSRDKSRGTNMTMRTSPTTLLLADDTCLDDSGSSAWPMSLAIGARVVPPVRGLSALLAAEIGLSGTDVFVRDLAPTAPFRLILAVGYDYDARPPPPPPYVPPPPPPPAPPPKGRLLGQVSDQGSGQPIAGAVVRIANSSLTPLATDDAGHFTSYELDPGDYELELSHADYEPRRCGTMIPSAGGEAVVLCTLEALPAAGTVKGSVRDQYGSSVAGARIQITGPSSQIASSDVAGDFVANELLPGDYTARVESESHLIRVVRFAVTRRQQTRLEIALPAKPTKSSVEIRGKEIRAAKLKFAKGSDELAPDAAQSVAELADLLLRLAALPRIRIQGDGGDTMALNRALAIKQRLVEAGVPDVQLEAAPEPASHVTITILE